MITSYNLTPKGPNFDLVTRCKGDDHHAVALIPERPLGTLTHYLKDTKYRESSIYASIDDMKLNSIKSLSVKGTRVLRSMHREEEDTPHATHGATNLTNVCHPDANNHSTKLKSTEGLRSELAHSILLGPDVLTPYDDNGKKHTASPEREICEGHEKLGATRRAEHDLEIKYAAGHLKCTRCGVIDCGRTEVLYSIKCDGRHHTTRVEGGIGHNYVAITGCLCNARGLHELDLNGLSAIL